MNKKVIGLVLIGIILTSLSAEAAIRPAANAVGVPLDGGLLAILAGAGIAYFARRKKKKEE